MCVTPLVIVTPSRYHTATLSTVGMAATNVKKGNRYICRALV
jgi:hypothetical protein